MTVSPPVISPPVGRAIAAISESTPHVLEARGVAVRYDGCAQSALSSVDFSIRAGERVLLLGPSGCGKTTLLRALEGSLPLVAGDVTRHGRVALIYQDLRLVAERTALQNVCAGAYGGMRKRHLVLGCPDAVRTFAMELLADLGLSGLEHRRVSELSGGQRQRVAIARALSSRPAVLLADEPLAALDRSNAQRVLTMLMRLQEKYGFALVLSVHNVAVDPSHFERALLVRGGRVHILENDEFEILREELARPLALFGDEDPTAHEATPAPLEMSFWRQLQPVAAPIAAVAVIAVLLVWALSSVEMGVLASSEALSGVWAFAKGWLPGSLAEARALPWARLFAALVETIQMAVVGTFAGIVLSLPLAVLASRQIGPPVIRHATRFLLNVIRTVPSIIWALVFVAAVGLGPVSGICALAIYSVGYLTKFFYEALENMDDRPALALRALGASRLQAFFGAILPAARATLVGSSLFMFEYNIRAASVLGVVGAGGIGADLMYYIEWRNFPAALAGLTLILIVVIALDALSGWWRRSLGAQRGV